ncbi:hypothetical protein DERF_002358 [Dermatophagoides farinae]|uniref:Uncharacterized protein n=1 Tax=Dermatophagoides farinae TaxID=6954 RepID=A0A922IBG4_DERFA|nr:hypothetical protein DERF_002358 [Dermatophagoides farinae]
MNKLHTSSRVKAPKSVPYSTEISPEAPAPLDRYIYLAIKTASIIFRFSDQKKFFEEKFNSYFDFEKMNDAKR